MLVNKLEIDNNIENTCEQLKPKLDAKVIDREGIYESILDSIHDSVFAVDKNYRIITANKGFRERNWAITGLDFKPGDSIYNKGENQHITDAFIACIERAMGGETFKEEFRFEANGSELYRESTFTPIFQAGEVIGVTCYSKDVSETKLSKVKLQEQEVLFRTLLENTHDGIAMLSAKGRLKYITPSVNRILGYSDAEMAEFKLLTLVHPSDIPTLKKFVEDLTPNYGASANIDYQMRTKSGRWRWLHCHYTNMLHQPSIKAFVVNYEDITEERELAIELENTVHDLMAADERQAAIINSLHAHIALLNQDGIIIEVNKAWKNFADTNNLISSNYCIGNNYIEVSELAICDGDNTGQHVANGIRDVLAGKKDVYSMEYTCHSSAEKRWYKVIVYPLYKQARGGVVVYHVEITDRKLADLQIEFHRRNRDALINSTTDLMWSIDANMRLITANHSFFRHGKNLREHRPKTR